MSLCFLTHHAVHISFHSYTIHTHCTRTTNASQWRIECKPTRHVICRAAKHFNFYQTIKPACMELNIKNQVDLNRLGLTIEAVEAKPGLAEFRFSIAYRRIDGGYNHSYAEYLLICSF